MKLFPLACVLSLLSLPALAGGGINQPTPAQLECRRNAPEAPKKIVFGFSGWLSYDWEFPVIYGMLGRGANQEVEFHYESWDSVYRTELTDVVRCAYELATKRYENSHGKAEYNSLVILGHSFGGNAAHDLAAELGRLGVAVDLVVTADARDPGNAGAGYAPSWKRPASVKNWLNFFERNDAFFVGFPVGGASNTEVGGMHLTVPMDPYLVRDTEEAVLKLPVARPAFAP